MADDTPENHDPHTTTSTKERWEYIGTVLAAIVILSLVVLMLGAGYGIVSLAAISQAWYLLYSTVVLAATGWTFGKGNLEAIEKIRGN